MALGPGKYDGIGEELAARFKAKGIIVVIIDGEKGTDFDLVGPALVREGASDLLESLAKDIRAQAEHDAAAARALASGKH
jgi:hypothetical protein